MTKAAVTARPTVEVAAVAAKPDPVSMAAAAAVLSPSAPGVVILLCQRQGTAPGTDSGSGIVTKALCGVTWDTRPATDASSLVPTLS